MNFSRMVSLGLAVTTTVAVAVLSGFHRDALAQGATPTITPPSMPVPELTRNPTPSPSPTGGPFPISTATPTVPTALEILDRMHSAVKKQGSLHIDTNLTSWLDANHFVKEHARLDLAWRNVLADRENDTWHRTTVSETRRVTRIEHRTFYLVGNVAASRQTPNPWYCERLKNVQLENLFLPLQVQVTKASIAGTLDFNGMPAWHIHASSAWASTWTNKSVQIDFIITQTDGLLRQMVIRGRAHPPSAAAPLQIVERYTLYRERLHIQLPSSCGSLARRPVAQ